MFFTVHLLCDISQETVEDQVELAKSNFECM